MKQVDKMNRQIPITITSKLQTTRVMNSLRIGITLCSSMGRSDNDEGIAINAGGW